MLLKAIHCFEFITVLLSNFIQENIGNNDNALHECFLNNHYITTASTLIALSILLFHNGQKFNRI